MQSAQDEQILIVKEKKYRSCLGKSARCLEKVFGYSENRICKECKKASTLQVNSELESVGMIHMDYMRWQMKKGRAE